MAELTKEALYEFLRTDLRVDTSAVEPDTSLMVSGLVDSFSMMELVDFVERTCEVKLEPKEINLDNLDTVAGILALAARVGGGSGDG